MKRLMLLLFATVITGAMAAALIVGASPLGTQPASGEEGEPQISTDKATYLPEETVTVTGLNFVPGQMLDIPITRPDGSIVKSNGEPGWDTVLAEPSGGFLYSYKLNGIEGLYTVEVYPWPWGGPESGEVPLATTTFLDGKYSLNFKAAKPTSYGQ